MASRELEPSGVSAVWPISARPADLPAVPAAYSYPSVAPKAFELNLATLLQIVWEWRWLLLSFIAAGLGAAVVTTLLTTPVYRSVATIEFNPPNVQVIDEARDEQPFSADAAFVETQIGLFKSRALAARVAQDLNLAADERFDGGDPDADRAVRQQNAAANIRQDFKVEKVGTSRLVRIAFSSTEPALAARVVNGFADGFIASSLERRYQSSSYARDFLQQQIANVRRDLEGSERQLVAYAQRQGIVNTASTGAGAQTPGDTASLTGASLVQINEALAAATTRRIQAEQAYRSSLGGRLTAEAGERTAALRNNRATLQAEYQDKLAVFRPDYPELVRLKSRIDALTQLIGQEEREVRSGRSGTLEADYRAALASENELRGRVSQLRGEVLNLRGRSIQYNILQREVDTNRALYDALLQKYKEIGVTGGIGVSYASIVDRGDVPGSPYSPNLLINLLIGLGAGALIGLAIILALEFVNDTIKSPDDVRNRLRLAFLGGVPETRGESVVAALRDPISPVSEAYFAVGSSLGFASDDGVPRTLMVTSTRAGEGKSTTTWALAQHFARLGERVLLIDADLRRPAFVTGHEREDGLSKLLTSRDALMPHVVPTDVERLHLLPCGPIPPNPAELLASPRMQAIVDEAEREFDLVIVDGPPILGLADSPLLATITRGAMLVVEAGKTRTRAAVEALNRMHATNANMVGCILTRYRHEVVGYGYRHEAYAYKSVDNRNREIRALTSQS